MSKSTKTECAKIFSDLTRPFIRPYLMGRLNVTLIVDDTTGHRLDLLVVEECPANENVARKLEKERKK